MKALKVGLNEKQVAIIGYQDLTELTAGVFCLGGTANLVVQGSKVSTESREDFVWHDNAISEDASISIEIIETNISDEAETYQHNKTEQNRKCSFCFESESVVGELFVGKYFPASICVSCIRDAFHKTENDRI